MKLALLVLALATVAPAQDKPRGPARVSGGVMAGQILTRVLPAYPPDAKAQGISGIVVMHAVIARDGSIANLTVVSGPEILRQAAIDAVSQWTYKPYLLNGEPTEVDTTITVNFSMEPPPTAPSQSDSGPSRPIRVSGGVLAGYSISRVQPVFPQFTRDQHISGAGVMHVLIRRDGHVKSVDYISGPEALGPYYVAAVRQWTYRPYLLNGEPVEVETTVTINFSMGG